MIKSVVRQYNWPPSEINNLFLDGAGYLSLTYWYNDVVEVNESIKAKQKNE
tara:strand:+ start:153 stop:305 length:153 start_codon:yes stop_codon:yes gene_type:complete